MPIYLTLKRGPKLYVEYARWARSGTRAGAWVEVRRERGELLLWLGRWHAIYTPARWSPGTSRGVLNGRSRPT